MEMKNDEEKRVVRSRVHSRYIVKDKDENRTEGEENRLIGLIGLKEGGEVKRESPRRVKRSGDGCLRPITANR